jgi:hypothetical protein
VSRRRARLAALLLALPLLAGCSQTPFADESYREEIPAALEAAGLGVTDAWADVSLSGATETLSVGGTILALGDPDASLLDDDADEEISDDLVQRIIAVALDGRSLPMSYFSLSLRDAADDGIDVDPALARLGASPRSDGSITMDDARRIAEGAEG